MCNYSDFVEQQGLKKGREEGHLESLSESVANLVRSGHFSIEAALDILKVSADIRSTVNNNKPLPMLGAAASSFCYAVLSASQISCNIVRTAYHKKCTIDNSLLAQCVQFIFCS